MEWVAGWFASNEKTYSLTKTGEKESSRKRWGENPIRRRGRRDIKGGAACFCAYQTENGGKERKKGHRRGNCEEKGKMVLGEVLT